MTQNGSTGRINAVLYARVSSKDQEREGFSIPAQIELLRNYARQQGITILQEFVESESGRPDKPLLIPLETVCTYGILRLWAWMVTRLEVS